MTQIHNPLHQGGYSVTTSQATSQDNDKSLGLQNSLLSSTSENEVSPKNAKSVSKNWGLLQNKFKQEDLAIRWQAKAASFLRGVLGISACQSAYHQLRGDMYHRTPVMAIGYQYDELGNSRATASVKADWSFAGSCTGFPLAIVGGIAGLIVGGVVRLVCGKPAADTSEIHKNLMAEGYDVRVYRDLYSNNLKEVAKFIGPQVSSVAEGLKAATDKSHSESCMRLHQAIWESVGKKQYVTENTEFRLALHLLRNLYPPEKQLSDVERNAFYRDVKFIYDTFIHEVKSGIGSGASNKQVNVDFQCRTKLRKLFNAQQQDGSNEPIECSTVPTDNAPSSLEAIEYLDKELKESIHDRPLEFADHTTNRNSEHFKRAVPEGVEGCFPKNKDLLTLHDVFDQAEQQIENLDSGTYVDAIKYLGDDYEISNAKPTPEMDSNREIEKTKAAAMKSMEDTALHMYDLRWQSVQNKGPKPQMSFLKQAVADITRYAEKSRAKGNSGLSDSDFQHALMEIAELTDTNGIIEGSYGRNKHYKVGELRVFLKSQIAKHENEGDEPTANQMTRRLMVLDALISSGLIPEHIEKQWSETSNLSASQAARND
ncbi:hypothetical protein AB1K70_03440 [Bremerella sp. JC770]|uniref:hypothetical protein n=1 Tax=Bremerella sp. JC770 TaxID=3232137 RepID=UPI00345941AF